ncbi:hotdog domain-containing protein [Thalassobaculum sp.]|uniref:hotdog domain-containing protein n=1 Tax=Thalassobaculum sp. TaxID=2022740 RepID=UPI0032EDD394
MSPSPRTLSSTAAEAVPPEPRGEPVSGPLTVPDDAGPGWIRSVMDKAASAVATRLAAGPVLAVAASRAAVTQAVAPGDRVRLHVEEMRYGSTSLTLTVAAWAVAQDGGAPERAAAVEYTYIAVDAEGLPRPILEQMPKACDDPAADPAAGDETWMPPT